MPCINELRETLGIRAIVQEVKHLPSVNNPKHRNRRVFARFYGRFLHPLPHIIQRIATERYDTASDQQAQHSVLRVIVKSGV